MVMQWLLFCPTSTRWGLGWINKVGDLNFQLPTPLEKSPSQIPHFTPSLKGHAVFSTFNFHYFKMIAITSWKHVLVAAAYSLVLFEILQWA